MLPSPFWHQTMAFSIGVTAWIFHRLMIWVASVDVDPLNRQPHHLYKQDRHQDGDVAVSAHQIFHHATITVSGFQFPVSKRAIGSSFLLFR
jgi:hypothetical protein